MVNTQVWIEGMRLLMLNTQVWIGGMTMTMNDNDNENTLFDHNIQIEIAIYKQFK